MDRDTLKEYDGQKFYEHIGILKSVFIIYTCIGNNFVGMVVKKGNKLYEVVSYNGQPYETAFTLRNIESNELIKCSRNKFTIPRK